MVVATGVCVWGGEGRVRNRPSSSRTLQGCRAWKKHSLRECWWQTAQVRIPAPLCQAV